LTGHRFSGKFKKSGKCPMDECGKIKLNNLVDYINPFLVGASMVFDRIFDKKLRRERIDVVTSLDMSHDVIIKIELSGDITGVIYYGMNFSIIYRIAEVLAPEMGHKKIKREYKDIMGELINMITGNSVNIISEKGVLISTPEIFSSYEFKAEKIIDNVFMSLPLYCSFGHINIYIYLKCMDGIFRDLLV